MFAGKLAAWRGVNRNTGFLCQGPQNEQCILWLDAVLFDFDLMLRSDTVACQKAGYVAWEFETAGEDRMVELFLEVAMDVHLCALRVDQYTASVVVKKEGDV